MNVNGVDMTPKSCNVIKDYHLYVSDDHENDTLFIQHCFGLIYESFRKKYISFKMHWILSDGCVGRFKSACSFYWLSWLHKEKVCMFW